MEEASCWSLMNFYHFSIFDWLIEISFLSFFTIEWMKSTDDNGYLGSCIDEERSKVRKAMWIAQHVNHQIFERIWRLGSCFQACLFESRFHKLQSNYLFSFFLNFIHSLLWLIDLIWKKNRLFVVCFIWFVCLFVSHSHSMKFRWDELRESSLFVCFTFKQRCLFISTTNQSMNEPNQFQLTLICDWFDCWLHHQPSFFDWLIDRCLWWMNEFESLIDWSISLTHFSFTHSFVCDWFDWCEIDWLICLFQFHLLWDWLIWEIRNC